VVRVTPVRWGILGTGHIAGVFTEDLLARPGHAVLAVGSRTPGTAAAFARRHQIPRAHGSYAELAADPDIDVVYVASPQSAHLADARLCLEAGRAVLVEKPFALTGAQAAELAQVARRQRRFAMEAMWMRFSPLVRTLQDLVADGVIGTVRTVTADFGIAVADQPDHRLLEPGLGGGALLDLGVYPVTLATMLLGRPDQVQAASHRAATGVDANTGILLRYPGGALALLHCSLEAESAVTAQVTGTRGRIELDAPFYRPAALTLIRAGGQPERRTASWAGHGYGFEADEVAACLRAGRTESALAPLAETTMIMTLLDEIRAAAG
jgi:predicted dehydrogenase